MAGIVCQVISSLSHFISCCFLIRSFLELNVESTVISCTYCDVEMCPIQPYHIISHCCSKLWNSSFFFKDQKNNEVLWSNFYPSCTGTLHIFTFTPREFLTLKPTHPHHTKTRGLPRNWENKRTNQQGLLMYRYSSRRRVVLPGHLTKNHFQLSIALKRLETEAHFNDTLPIRGMSQGRC